MSRPGESRKNFDEGSFTRTVGAEDGQEGTLFQFETDSRHGFQHSERFVQIFYLDHRLSHRAG
jgi:hypothetical protein